MLDACSIFLVRIYTITTNAPGNNRDVPTKAPVFLVFDKDGERKKFGVSFATQFSLSIRMGLKAGVGDKNREKFSFDF